MKKKVLKSKYYWLKRRYRDVKLRLRLHTDAMHRGMRLWHQQHPDEAIMPDAADHYAWMVADYERMHDAFVQIRDLVKDSESSMRSKLDSINYIAKSMLTLVKR